MNGNKNLKKIILIITHTYYYETAKKAQSLCLPEKISSAS